MSAAKLLSSFALQRESLAPHPGRGVVKKARGPKLQSLAALVVATSVGATFSPPRPTKEIGAFARIPPRPLRLCVMLLRKNGWASRRGATSAEGRQMPVANSSGIASRYAD